MTEDNNKEFICKVASIIDNKKIVINKGSNEGIHINQMFLIYKLGDEIIDPDTKEILGQLEIVLGRGIVTHVQEKIATLTSNIVKQGQTRVIKNPCKNALLNIIGGDQIITEPGDIEPFNEVNIGDFAKPI